MSESTVIRAIWAASFIVSVSPFLGVISPLPETFAKPPFADHAGVPLAAFACSPPEPLADLLLDILLLLELLTENVRGSFRLPDRTTIRSSCRSSRRVFMSFVVVSRRVFVPLLMFSCSSGSPSRHARRSRVGPSGSPISSMRCAISSHRTRISEGFSFLPSLMLLNFPSMVVDIAFVPPVRGNSAPCEGRALHYACLR